MSVNLRVFLESFLKSDVVEYKGSGEAQGVYFLRLRDGSEMQYVVNDLDQQGGNDALELIIGRGGRFVNIANRWKVKDVWISQVNIVFVLMEDVRRGKFIGTLKDVFQVASRYPSLREYRRGTTFS